MKRFTPGLMVLALSSLAAATFAADVVQPTAAAAQAASTSPSPSVNKDVAVRPITFAAAKASAASSTPAVRKMFCLNMAIQCFALNERTGNTSLSLQAPDIRRLVSDAELRQQLNDPDEMDDQPEQVQVEGTRPEVYVPGGLMTLPWAVMHPTQAWRIFLPVPSSQAK